MLRRHRVRRRSAGIHGVHAVESAAAAMVMVEQAGSGGGAEEGQCLSRRIGKQRAAGRRMLCCVLLGEATSGGGHLEAQGGAQQRWASARLRKPRQRPANAQAESDVTRSETSHSVPPLPPVNARPHCLEVPRRDGASPASQSNRLFLHPGCRCMRNAQPTRAWAPTERDCDGHGNRSLASSRDALARSHTPATRFRHTLQLGLATLRQPLRQGSCSLHRVQSRYCIAAVGATAPRCIPARGCARHAPLPALEGLCLDLQRSRYFGSGSVRANGSSGQPFASSATVARPSPGISSRRPAAEPVSLSFFFISQRLPQPRTDVYQEQEQRCCCRIAIQN